jgi:ATP-dependent RNA helicase RhlE
MSFNKFNLSESIMKGLKEAGYKIPTPIQDEAIPIVLEGKDVLGCAQTGTGKTAAFSLPIVQLLNTSQVDGPKSVRTLIVTPTRELAIQIGECITTYARHTSIRHVVIYGGVGQKRQTDSLRRGVDIIVATPGRLLDLMQQGWITLSKVEYLVLDEADRMLDMGFIHDINRILEKVPDERQTLFFSATMPAEIRKLSNRILDNPHSIQIAPESPVVDVIDQSVYFVDKRKKKELLLHLLKENNSIESALVFSRTKHGANKIATYLQKRGVNADAIHGNKSQNARQNALNNFKNRRIRVLIATDIAARGIDIDQLSHVFNLDLPEVPETYVHRIGRTGRAGSEGTAIAFCDGEERHLLRDIQKMLKKEVPIILDHPFVPLESPNEAVLMPGRVVATTHKKKYDDGQRPRHRSNRRRRRRGNARQTMS